MPSKKVTKRKQPKFRPEPALHPILGKRPITQQDAVKKTWRYIQSRKGVQEKRTIHVARDPNLKKLAPRRKKITMFDLPKLLFKNLKRVD